MNAQNVQKALTQYANTTDAAFLQRFFKTGKGEYGEGDVFIGVRVPQTRKVCKKFCDLPRTEIQTLLDSKVHEHRMAAVLIMVDQFRRADSYGQRELFDQYITNLYNGRINNWDIIDSSAPYILGLWLLNKPKDIFYTLARDNSVWCRRAAVLGTATYIKEGKPEITLELAEILLKDSHDLIHKAVGWMLREIGKAGCGSAQLAFLDAHSAEMPRTMLRYAIERLPVELRNKYMQAGRER
jgi:3-methyladenine DNA glycosylase AlkD